MNSISFELKDLQENLQQKKLELQNIERQKAHAKDFATLIRTRTLISRLNSDIIIIEKKLKLKEPLLKSQLAQLTQTKDKELKQRLNYIVSGETFYSQPETKIISTCLLLGYLQLYLFFFSYRQSYGELFIKNTEMKNTK